MKTPICDFVKNYLSDNMIRLHMPGHKGKSFLGIEPFDITEVTGADALFEAEGIIKKSEDNAAEIFGTGSTLYSAEGSSLSIRAMLCLAVKYALAENKKPRILAGRNAHKTFICAAALLQFSMDFIPEKAGSSYLSCDIDYDDLEGELKKNNTTALYITSPDYLGNMADIKRLAELCRRNGVLLLVDNAHGAYLKFLSPSRHPIDLGADMCCDSAHKTLPVLTGGGYLHISGSAPEFLRENAKNAMALFASTSPSYLILQSLDMANKYLSEGYKERLAEFVKELDILKNKLSALGHSLISCEELKITIEAKPYGYTGYEFAGQLRQRGIECEFADPDFTVMMLTPENGTEALEVIYEKIADIPRKSIINTLPPRAVPARRVMSVRDALFAPSERISVTEAEGRVLSELNVGCPPAVPIVICGERIDRSHVELFLYYGIEFCRVVREE